jgi:hypothetical protein
MIRQGTYVAADNVVFARIDDYRSYVKHLATNGIVETKLEETYLEYSLPERLGSSIDITPHQLVDGIEMTVYLCDPPRPTQHK